MKRTSFCTLLSCTAGEAVYKSQCRDTAAGVMLYLCCVFHGLLTPLVQELPVIVAATHQPTHIMLQTCYHLYLQEEFVRRYPSTPLL
jgi:hypothetical protein